MKTKSYFLNSIFSVGPFHLLNPVPTDEAEALAHGNAMAAAGNYPVGTSECFNVGVSGGCGSDCFVYQKGECDCPEEMEQQCDGEGRIYVGDGTLGSLYGCVGCSGCLKRGER